MLHLGLNKNQVEDQDNLCSSKGLESDVTAYILNDDFSQVYWSNDEPGLDQSQIAAADAFPTFVDFYPECSTYSVAELKSSTFTQAISEQFSLSCKDKSECEIAYNYEDLPYYCLDEILRRAFASEFT